MEKGESSQYRGKSLDEISVIVEEPVCEVEESSSDIDEAPTSNKDNEKDNNIMISEVIAVQETPLKQKKSIKSNKQTSSTPQNKKKNVVIIPWANEDKIKLNTFFKNHMLLGKVHNKKECENLMKTYPNSNKPWKKIKNFVYNAINQQKKKMKY